jgi:hypothetical protein
VRKKPKKPKKEKPMALNAEQQEFLERIFEDERTMRRRNGETPLVAFALMSSAQQRAFLQGLVQARIDERNARLAALPTIHATETTTVTEERDTLQGVFDEV